MVIDLAVVLATAYPIVWLYAQTWLEVQCNDATQGRRLWGLRLQSGVRHLLGCVLLKRLLSLNMIRVRKRSNPISVLHASLAVCWIDSRTQMY